MGKAIHTEAKIIKTGGELAKAGITVTPWRIHKELGSKGNFARIEKVWQEHCSTTEQKTTEIELVLPEEVELKIEQLLEDMRERSRAIVSGVTATLLDDHRRQTAAMNRVQETQLAEKQEEIDYLRQVADDLEEELSAILSAQSRAVSSRRSSAKASPPARRSPSRASQKKPSSGSKPQDPSPVPPQLPA